MKAVIHTKYGPPEVTKLSEVATPVPKDDEVLIKIYATTVNRTDCGFRSAEYFISRFWSGLFRPKYKTLGCEFAGEIETVGKNVTTFKKGDRVFGYNDQKFGGHAEFLTIKGNDTIALIPPHLNYSEAAPITEGAHYALGNIRAAKVKQGDTVLVYGATGAIGSAAVQLLKHFGAKVIAVCNTQNVSLVKSIGADIVIDYETRDFTDTNLKFHFIFDAVGKSSFRKCKPLLCKGGIYISTEFGKNGANVFHALFTPLFSDKKVLFPIPTFKKEDIEFLKVLVEQGEYAPLIDRAYKLEEIVEAYKYVETGQKIGNVIITVREEC